MTNILIGIAIGGAFILAFVKVEANLRHREEIKQLKIENEILRTEREELKNLVGRNTFQLNDLTALAKFHQEQIERCLEWLSGISSIRDEVELQKHIVTTKRFRQKYGLFVENENTSLTQSSDTYISD